MPDGNPGDHRSYSGKFQRNFCQAGGRLLPPTASGNCHYYIIIIVRLWMKKIKVRSRHYTGWFYDKKNSRAKQCAEWRLKCDDTKTAALCATRSRAKFADRNRTEILFTITRATPCVSAVVAVQRCPSDRLSGCHTPVLCLNS